MKIASQLSIIIPAYNEAKTIGPLVEAVRSLGYDCIVIDDGSVDKTDASGKSSGCSGVKDRRLKAAKAML